MLRYPKVLSISSKKLQKLSKGFIKSFFFVLVILLIGVYYQTEIYDFDKPEKILGSKLYNPYLKWDNENTVKANFHAHTKAWKGLTNGANTEEEIRAQYKKLGYDVAAISNYHTIDKNADKLSINIPCFEQGYNTSKIHFLAIDASETADLDFPFFQGTSQKQSRINKILKTATLVAIAHPKLKGAFTQEDLKNLKGYQLFEVMSPYTESFDLWDYALKSGNLSWLLANDDTHDLKKQAAGRFFNLISVPSKNKNTTIEALKEGNHVAYASEDGFVDVFLDKISVDSNTVRYRFSGNIGTVRMVKDGKKYDIEPFGKITLNPQDRYVRFEVSNEKCRLYTNPIYRNANLNLGLNNFLVKLNLPHTMMYRLACLAFGFLCFLAIFYGIPKTLKTS
jgi:hypothetical protein